MQILIYYGKVYLHVQILLVNIYGSLAVFRALKFLTCVLISTYLDFRFRKEVGQNGTGTHLQ